MTVAVFVRSVPRLHGRVTTLWENRIPEGLFVFGGPPERHDLLLESCGRRKVGSVRRTLKGEAR